MLLYKLGYITCFVTIVFIRFYNGFLVYIIIYYSCLHHAYHSYSIPPVSCSYCIISCVFSAGYRLLYLSCSCMLVLTTQFSMRVYNSNLSIHVSYLCTPLGIRITTPWGVLTPLDPHVQVSELGLMWVFLLRTNLTLRSRQTNCSSSPFLALPGWLAASPTNS